MTKIRITGLEKELKRTKLRIANAIARSNFSEYLQNESVKEIREQGLMPRIRPLTVKQRKYLARYNPTHPDYIADKSNLTLTGQLLDAIKVKFQASKLMFRYDAPKRKHKKYKIKKGRSKADMPSLKYLLEIQNAARPILQIFQRREFVTRIEKNLIASIKRFFK